MKILDIQGIEEFVKKGPTLLTFLGEKRGYILISLRYEYNPNDKMLSGGICKNECFETLYKISKVIHEPIKLKYLRQENWKRFYLYIPNLTPIKSLAFNEKLLNEAMTIYKKQFEILRQVFQ